MRTEPNIISEAELLRRKERTKNIARIVALCLAGGSVFGFFFKLLFF